MSGSFWKFGTDYSSESSLSRLLNKAFIKIEEDEKETDAYKGGALSLNKDLEKGNDEKNLILQQMQKQKMNHKIHPLNWKILKKV